MWFYQSVCNLRKHSTKSNPFSCNCFHSNNISIKIWILERTNTNYLVKSFHVVCLGWYKTRVWNLIFLLSKTLNPKPECQHYLFFCCFPVDLFFTGEPTEVFFGDPVFYDYCIILCVFLLIDHYQKCQSLNEKGLGGSKG